MSRFKVYGHQSAISLFESSLNSSRLHHAYLLIGPDRIGKKTIATQLATIVTAPNADEFTKQRIASGGHPDVWFINRETKVYDETTVGKDLGTSITIDAVRDVIIKAKNHPFEGNMNVFIFDGAEFLNLPATNALLKILEEPSPNVLLLLLTENRDAILPTIWSRCIPLSLQSMALGELEHVLHQDLGHGLEESKNVARLSEGRIGWAISALENQTFLAERHQQIEKIVGILKGDLKVKFQYAEELSRKSRDRALIRSELDMWLSWFRDIILVQNSLISNITNVAWKSTIQSYSDSCNQQEALEASKAIIETKDYIEKNVNARILLETLMLKLPPLQENKV